MIPNPPSSVPPPPSSGQFPPSLADKISQLTQLTRRAAERASEAETKINQLQKWIHDRGGMPKADEMIARDTTGKLGDLVRENQALNQVLRDYESALEMIMVKFRAQANSAQREKRDVEIRAGALLQEERQKSFILSEENAALRQRLNQAMAVMRDALAAEESSDENTVRITALLEENLGLRRMLGIAGQ
ncbi:hypothetical protein HDU93_002739 [Gonapodya sp. JEL0774]|nr:hypothetical protein HDU93_002739 [Gonapodya sp. JEL0774]